jgi:hypothetical protein
MHSCRLYIVFLLLICFLKKTCGHCLGSQFFLLLSDLSLGFFFKGLETQKFFWWLKKLIRSNFIVQEGNLYSSNNLRRQILPLFFPFRLRPSAFTVWQLRTKLTSKQAFNILGWWANSLWRPENGPAVPIAPFHSWAQWLSVPLVAGAPKRPAPDGGTELPLAAAGHPIGRPIQAAGGRLIPLTDRRIWHGQLSSLSALARYPQSLRQAGHPVAPFSSPWQLIHPPAHDSLACTPDSTKQTCLWLRVNLSLVTFLQLQTCNGGYLNSDHCAQAVKLWLRPKASRNLFCCY